MVYKTRWCIVYIDPDGTATLDNQLYEDIDMAKAEVNAIAPKYGRFELRRALVFIDSGGQHYD